VLASGRRSCIRRLCTSALAALNCLYPAPLAEPQLTAAELGRNGFGCAPCIDSSARGRFRDAAASLPNQPLPFGADVHDGENRFKTDLSGRAPGIAAQSRNAAIAPMDSLGRVIADYPSAPHRRRPVFSFRQLGSPGSTLKKTQKKTAQSQ
jgi:hypothetical protein